MKAQADSRPSTNATPALSRGSIFELLSSLVLLGGPIFYVLGRVYLEAYWSTLNVSPSLMAVDAEEYIYFGLAFIVNGLVMLTPKTGANAILIAPVVSIVSLAGVGFSVWVSNRIRATVRRRLQRTLTRVRNYCANKRSVVEALSVSASFLSAACVAILGFLTTSLALLVPLVVASSVGQWRGERLRSEMTTTNRASHPRVRVTGSEISNGQLIECTENWCVVYAYGKFIPVRLNEVQWLTGQSPVVAEHK